MELLEGSFVNIIVSCISLMTQSSADETPEPAFCRGITEEKRYSQRNSESLFDLKSKWEKQENGK